MLVDVLLGEANDGHAELAEAGLREQGIVRGFHRSYDGPETLAGVRRVWKRGKNPIDVPLLVLLDVGLPELSGIEVMRELKRDRCLCRIPVVMMTTACNFEQAAECRGLGCDLYVAKWSVFLGLPGFAGRLGVLLDRYSSKDALEHVHVVGEDS